MLLSSVAYGPEQILIVLVTLGAVAFWYSIPIAVRGINSFNSTYLVLSTNYLCLSSWWGSICRIKKI